MNTAFSIFNSRKRSTTDSTNIRKHQIILDALLRNSVSQLPTSVHMQESCLPFLKFSEFTDVNSLKCINELTLAETIRNLWHVISEQRTRNAFLCMLCIKLTVN